MTIGYYYVLEGEVLAYTPIRSHEDIEVARAILRLLLFHLLESPTAADTEDLSQPITLAAKRVVEEYDTYFGFSVRHRLSVQLLLPLIVDGFTKWWAKSWEKRGELLKTAQQEASHVLERLQLVDSSIYLGPQP